MRRDFLWYGIAICWALGAGIGMLQRHIQQAIPAIFFAVVFALIGVWIGRRDAPLRRLRLDAKKQSHREPS